MQQSRGTDARGADGRHGISVIFIIGGREVYPPTTQWKASLHRAPGTCQRLVNLITDAASLTDLEAGRAALAARVPGVELDDA